MLYSDQPSRPNVPVNVMVGLEAIKAGFGWSDEELYEAYLYNLQVRYALGYDRLGDGEFEIRSLYNFRRRLSEYNLNEGVNLLEQAFEAITDQQIVELKVRTGVQRMDSTQIASNILDASRLHLLVEGIQRLYRLLSEEEQRTWSETFAAYLKGTAGQYAYHVKGKAATQEHIQHAGQALYTLLAGLKAAYASHPTYQVVQRLFNENFHVTQETVRLKENRELPAGCLQSLDDLEATYHVKGTQPFKGYVANVTETCDPENEVQLITKVQVASNTTADPTLLNEALPDLKQRTELHTLHTDGGFPSEANDQVLHDLNIRLLQTGIRGAQPDPNHFNLSDFQIEQNAAGQPTCVTCPNGQTASVTPGKTTGWFVRFPAEACSACLFQLEQRCRAKPQQRDTRYYIDFTLNELRVAQRRKDYLAQKRDTHNLRAAVEATVRSLKHPFPASQLPVRGKFRMTCMMIASAIHINVRRIWRYQIEAAKKSADSTASLFSRLWLISQNLAHFLSWHPLASRFY
ncbi:MAG TPA: transposase [Anaerolineales bacterium]|nr:transposase [Anaerolineales bacterium]